MLLNFSFQGQGSKYVKNMTGFKNNKEFILHLVTNYLHVTALCSEIKPD